MTRRQKIEWIKKHLPELYRSLNFLFPNLTQNPINATFKEIELYNELISLVFKRYEYDSAFIETFQF